MFNIAEFDYADLVKHQLILRERIGTRMLHADCEAKYLSEKAKYVSTKDPRPIDKEWIKLLKESLDKVKGSFAIANKNFNQALEELTEGNERE